MEKRSIYRQPDICSWPDCRWRWRIDDRYIFLRALCSHSMESWKTSSFTCCWANSVDDDLMLCTGDGDVDDSLPLRFSVFWQFQWESVVWSLMAIHHIRYLHEYYCGIQNIYLSICYCLSAPNAFLAYIESDGCNRGLTVLCVLGNEASWLVYA